jgi:hypothetical protein
VILTNNLWVGEAGEVLLRDAGTNSIIARHNSFLATPPEIPSIFMDDPSFVLPYTKTLFIDDGGDTFTADFRSNFWGTDSSDEIAEDIWDANDTFDIKVSAEYEPFLTAPHPRTPGYNN